MRRSARLLTALGVLAAVLAGGWALDAGHPGRARAIAPPPLVVTPEPEQAAALAGLEHVAAVEPALRAEHEAAVAAEAERLAEEERQRARAQARPSAPQAFSAVRPGCEGDWPIPAWIVARESGCNYGAVNRTGCGGYSCVGAYQFDLRHWIAREAGGWGGCAHLGDWTVPEHQDACAAQMSQGGTNLRPWGY